MVSPVTALDVLQGLQLAVVLLKLGCLAALAQELEWQSSQTLGIPPAGADMFQLNDLEAFKKYSRVKNFEIVGHAYLNTCRRSGIPAGSS